MNLKLISTCALAALFTTGLACAQEYELSSPDGNLTAEITNDKSLHFFVKNNGTTLIPSVKAAMEFDNGSIPKENATVVGTSKRSEDSVIHPPVPIKNADIPDQYNELTIRYEGDYSVVFRAYNDAVVYRFETGMPGEVIVKNETCQFTVPEDSTAWYSFTKNWMNEYQHQYEKESVGDIGKKKSQLPILFDIGDAGKIMLTESNVYDYPGLYITGGGDSSGSLTSIFPPAVKSEKKNDRKDRHWDRIFKPDKTFDYIAKTSGTRSFPWRIFAWAAKDTDLLNNEIVYKTADPSRIENTDWIKPGQVAWDWWNANNITGVDFRAGINNDTYKYYIDFAARNNIPYIVVDDGWYVLGDAMKEVPEIDIKELVDYGKQKGVEVMLWVVWRTLDNHMEETLDLYRKWGVKGIKVDFMNRDDQAVVNFYWKCAKVAAEHHMLVDFHGAHKPAGLQRTYPNVLNFEALDGLETSKWSTKASPGMAVTLPFIRMFTGPMDYTPGAMRNAQKKDFQDIFNVPMSQGTRCQQLAMYVLYDSPLQMLCDTPTAYEKEKESLKFITSVPTTWDKTIPLEGEIGQYLAVARRHGDQYFVGAMTNWTSRTLTIDMSFLPEGEHKAVIFQDGINADRNAVDYKRVERTVTKDDKLKIHLAPGGGWAARID